MTHKLSGKIVVLPSFYPMELDYPRGSFFEEQTRLIRAKGIDCRVVFNENRSIASFGFHKIKTAHFQLEEKIENGIPVLRRKSWSVIPARFQLGNRLWIYASVKLMQEYIARHGKPDMMHVHCVFNAGIVAQRIKELYQIPYIITEHSSAFALGNIPAKKLKEALSAYKNASKVIVVSNSFRKLLLEKTGLEEEKVEVIPNFIDSDYFSMYNFNSKKEKYIFTVCFHEKNKRLDRLLDAFKLLVPFYPDWTLIIGGDGSETKYLKLKAEELGIDDQVHFTGFLSKSQIRHYLSQSSIFVSSSDYETFGIVLIEAMAMGVPVVSTDSGGPGDIITSETGIIVNKNAEDLKEGIAQLIENYDRYDKKTIIKHVETNYSGRVIAEKYIDIYKSVLGLY